MNPYDQLIKDIKEQEAANSSKIENLITYAISNYIHWYEHKHKGLSYEKVDMLWFFDPVESIWYRTAYKYGFEKLDHLDKAASAFVAYAINMSNAYHWGLLIDLADGPNSEKAPLSNWYIDKFFKPNQQLLNIEFVANNRLLSFEIIKQQSKLHSGYIYLFSELTNIPIS